MSGSVLTGIAFVCCISGFVLNSMYAKQYGEPAIQWKPFILQSICICGVLSNLPDGELSGVFLFWATATVISYVSGLWLCRQHAGKQNAGPGDTASAMAAQAIFPLGIVLAVMMIAGMVVFGFMWAH